MSQPTSKSLVQGQWLKPLQAMLSLLALSSCFEEGTTDEETLQLKIAEKYKEHSEKFLMGSESGEECRLSMLFTTGNKFKLEIFPKFAGMRIGLYDINILQKKTIRSSVMFDGKALHTLAKRTLKDAKIYLASWNHTLKADGTFYSGKNEDDSLKEVLSKCDDDVDEEEKGDDEEAGDNDGMQAHFPVSMYAFIVCGPYFKDKFNFPVCTVLNIDGPGESRAQSRQAIHEENASTRAAEPGRGISSLDSQRLSAAEELNRITRNQQALDAIQSNIENAKLMWDISPAGQEKDEHFSVLRGLCEEKKRLSDRIIEDNASVEAEKRARLTEPLTTPHASTTRRTNS